MRLSRRGNRSKSSPGQEYPVAIEQEKTGVRCDAAPAANSGGFASARGAGRAGGSGVKRLGGGPERWMSAHQPADRVAAGQPADHHWVPEQKRGELCGPEDVKWAQQWIASTNSIQ